MTKARATSFRKHRRSNLLSPDDRETAIRQAAVDSIHKFGPQRVSIEDIVALAGVSRSTFYRFFDGRDAVMEAVMMNRLEIIAERVKALLSRCKDFSEAIVRGSLETLRLAREDEVLAALTHANAEMPLDFQRGKTPPTRHRLFLSIWSGVFERARNDGTLRPDLSLVEAQDWLMSIHYMLNLRDDLSVDEKAAVLKTFVLPSLTNSGAASTK